MKTDTLTWKVYKLLFLDIWHHQFFHCKLKPQEVDFTDQELSDYLDELNLSIKGYQGSQEVKFTDKQPVTLFYANHPSTLDALYVYVLLKKVDPFFVSFLHNELHFKFLKKRTIPVAAYFKSQEPNVLGLKMKFAKAIEAMDKDQARRMNKQVSQKAVQKLAQGKSVVIFPSGGWGKWQDGIGFIINQFYEQYPKRELVLQPLKTKSFGEIHSVLHGLLHCMRIKVPGKVRIKVGKKILLSQLLKNEIPQTNDLKQKAKSIRFYLEDNYKKL
jgi:hypothetical protein